jgi:hypothetical protein
MGAGGKTSAAAARPSAGFCGRYLPAVNEQSDADGECGELLLHGLQLTAALSAGKGSRWSNSGSKVRGAFRGYELNVSSSHLAGVALNTPTNHRL